ncbi:hypothetical protein NFI96_017016 [Prochilodus magdalenae]|nr:hypothetical protein NFI96_017016 [Prochilodus magdalenae]
MEHQSETNPIMVKIDTINELSQLKDFGFGRPSPRHGLNLLYWFAHEYVDINSYGQMVPKNQQTNPKTGAYGFHLFSNFKDEDDDYLLPRQNFPYYGVGNLNAPGANKLPQYVKKDFTHHQDSSNKDRIMVQLKDGYFDRVYITEHTDKTNFGQTRRISQGLIKTIKNLASREEFLRQMNYYQNNNQSYEALPRAGYSSTMQSYQYINESRPHNQSHQPPKDDSWWCTIL